MSLAADGLPDNRVTCSQCTHALPKQHFCHKYRMHIILEQPLRCVGFDPLPHVQDRRDGAARWPGFRELIEEVRELDKRVRK